MCVLKPAAGLLLAPLVAMTGRGCAAFALSSGSELDPSGEKIYTQVQVMLLVSKPGQSPGWARPWDQVSGRGCGFGSDGRTDRRRWERGWR